jgi:hypothetical protein
MTDGLGGGKGERGNDRGERGGKRNRRRFVIQFSGNTL